MNCGSELCYCRITEEDTAADDDDDVFEMRLTVYSESDMYMLDSSFLFLSCEDSKY